MIKIKHVVCAIDHIFDHLVTSCSGQNSSGFSSLLITNRITRRGLKTNMPRHKRMWPFQPHNSLRTEPETCAGSKQHPVVRDRSVLLASPRSGCFLCNMLMISRRGLGGKGKGGIILTNQIWAFPTNPSPDSTSAYSQPVGLATIQQHKQMKKKSKHMGTCRWKKEWKGEGRENKVIGVKNV